MLFNKRFCRTTLLILLVLNIFLFNIISIKTTDGNAVISNFSENILISTRDSDYSHHVEPTLAISKNDTIFVGWKNAYGHNTVGVRVSFSKSSNYGKTWTNPFDMPMFEGIYTGQSDPWLIWDETGLFFAYLEYSIETDELSQITVTKSINYGASWSSPVRATYGEGFADKETMTVSDNGVIFIAYDDITNYTTVRLSSSSDNGKSYYEKGVIADAINQPVNHLAPYIITDSKNDIFVAWVWFHNNESWGDVYLTSSSNQGESFTPPIDVNTDSENCSFEFSYDQRPSRISIPVIKFDQNNRLYVLWAEIFEPSGTWDIYLRYSDNYASTWSERYQINPQTEGNQWQPDMDVDSQGRLHIVWYDDNQNFVLPYYRTIFVPNDPKEEIFWGESIVIADERTPSSFTRPGDYFTVRVDSKGIPHVVWTDGRSEDELDIYYAHGIVLKSSETIDFLSVWIINPLIFIILTLRLKKKKKAIL